MSRLLALSLIATSFAAHADAPKSLALVAVNATGGADGDDASDMNDALTSVLAGDARASLVERQDLQRVMKEQALAQSGVISDSAQIKVAQLVNAKFIAVGGIKKRGRGYVLSLRAIDAESAQVAYSETLRIGNDEQITPGSQKLARKMLDKLFGPAAVASAGSDDDAVGDFDAAQVKDGARQMIQAVALRFPKVAGSIVDSVPNGTASCSFPMSNAAFAGEFFEISGTDDVTGQDRTKGYFLLQHIDGSGCSGRFKAESGQAIGSGDRITPMPIKFSLMPLEAASGAQPELAKLFTDEAKAAIETFPQFQLANDPQLTAMGRVAGPRGSRSVQLQILDKKGNVVAKVDQQFGF